MGLGGCIRFVGRNDRHVVLIALKGNVSCVCWTSSLRQREKGNPLEGQSIDVV